MRRIAWIAVAMAAALFAGSCGGGSSPTQKSDPKTEENQQSELEVITSGKRARMKGLINSLTDSLKMYELDHGEYPPSGVENLKVLWKVTKVNAYFEPGPKDLNAKGELVDVWGNPLVYRNNAEAKRRGAPNPDAQNKHSVDLYSFGPNGLDEKGAGDDINNWE